MKLIEIISAFWAFVKSLPRKLLLRFFANSHASYYDMSFGLNGSPLYLDRKYYIAKMKSSHFLRASGYTLILYLLSVLITYGISHVSSCALFIVVISLSISLSAVIGWQILFRYVPRQFESTLYEDSTEKNNQEARGLKRSLKILWVLLCINVFVYSVCQSSFSMNSMYFVDFIVWGILFCLESLPVVLIGRRYISIHQKELVGPIQICEIYDTHYVDMAIQYIIEKSNGNLYVFPIPEWHNPRFSETPTPYQIPIKSVSYIQIGNRRIKYDFENLKWKYISS